MASWRRLPDRGASRSTTTTRRAPSPKESSRHFPIPVGLVARLAVATTHQGRGVGSDLLRAGLRRLVAASEQIGMRAALVHAIDEHAAAFHRRLGFEPATTDGLRLRLPLAAVRTALAGDG